jgi:hypothetical protein
MEENLPLNTNDKVSINVTKETLLVPSNILCKCDERTILKKGNNNPLYGYFSFLPIFHPILNEILPHIGECARQMSSYDSWEMDVMLFVGEVTTWNIKDHSYINDDESRKSPIEELY